MTSSTDMKYSVPAGSSGDGSGGGGMGSIPTAAQIRQRELDIRSKLEEYKKYLDLRVKALDLAARFPPTTDGPMKLAREIYKFLSDTEV